MDICIWDTVDNLLLLLALHPVAQVGWTGWSVHWSTVIGIAALAALYLWRAARAPAPGTPTGRQKLTFFAGLVVMFASLNGPLHDLSDSFLFSAHMVQHLLLTLLLPPLLIAGTPGWMLRPLIKHGAVRAVAKFVTRPVSCYVIFNLVIIGWHLPVFYNAALANHNIHIGEHLMFIAAAVLLWWPFLSPMPELPRLSYPGQLLYCFLTTLPMSVVAIYITMADHVLYPAYAAAPRLWHITPMMDQQAGGLIMWVPGSFVFYGLMTFVFFKWVARGEDSLAAAQVDWVAKADPVR
ncbi:MAG TPA: cytochrome c oxidase assembly protein [Gemmatimonadaceae bacterium]|nr:cytochrome c oxidase assembly protein [Gemmatimonadaceae bacterium]